MSANRLPLANPPRDAAEELIEAYWERAYRFAAMVTNNEQETADIAQEALVTVLRKRGSFDPTRGSFESWLWRIVLNVTRDAGRAASRRRALVERLQWLRRTEAESNAEVTALQHISDKRLLEAVRRLAKLPRTLIALRFGAGLPYREIGKQMGLSEAAALMATRRALARLRKEIEPKETLE